MISKSNIVNIFIGISLSYGAYAEQTQSTDSPREIRDIDVAGPRLTDLFVPYIENGNIIGYKVSPKMLERGFFKHSLLPEDVITTLNGINLVNNNNLIRALRKLVKSPSLDMKVLRDGKQIVISIPIP